MVLTERQMKLRKLFRDKLLHLWKCSAPLTMVKMHMRDEIEFEFVELDDIPSIRQTFGVQGCSVWLADHFHKVSNAMFDGRSIEQALVIWSREKYQSAPRTALDKEKEQVRRNNKSNARGAEFISHREDFRKTAWHTCK